MGSGAALFKSESQARRLQLQGKLTAFHKESGETPVKYIVLKDRARKAQERLQLCTVNRTSEVKT